MKKRDDSNRKEKGFQGILQGQVQVQVVIQVQVDQQRVDEAGSLLKLILKKKIRVRVEEKGDPGNGRTLRVSVGRDDKGVRGWRGWRGRQEREEYEKNKSAQGRNEAQRADGLVWLHEERC